MDFGASVRRFALGALASSSSWLAERTAHAQAAGTKKPNILVIFGDDIGYRNVSAYNQGMMITRRRTSTASPTRAHCLPTTTDSRAARQAARRSSLEQTGPIPHRPDDCWTAGSAHRPAQRGSHAGRTAQAALADMTFQQRQKPSRRSEPVPSHGARLRRILRDSAPMTRSKKNPKTSYLSEGTPASLQCSGRAGSSVESQATDNPAAADPRCGPW